jgi:hypothetical protein
VRATEEVTGFIGDLFVRQQGCGGGRSQQSTNQADSPDFPRASRQATPSIRQGVMTDLAIALAVTVAALIQGAIGVGFALVVAPIAATIRPDLLPAAILVLMFSQ